MANAADAAVRWEPVRGFRAVVVNSAESSSFSFLAVPLAEQRVLAEKIRAAFAVLGRMKAFVVGTGRRLVVIDQAALAKAFRGDLIAQDADDEPASMLIDRIRTSRADEKRQPRRVRGQRRHGRATSDPGSGAGESGRARNGRRDPSLDLVAATSPGLDAAAVRAAIKALVDAGQVRVHGRARGTTYEWTA